MVDHVMPADVPGFLQIIQVGNVGADGGGNSVSGSEASSAHAFTAWINRKPPQMNGMTEVGSFRGKGSARSFSVDPAQCATVSSRIC